MREMVDDYTRQLELRDETIRKLENAQPQFNVKQMRQDIDTLNHENRQLKEKLNHLNRELDMQGQSQGARTAQLQDECDRLNRVLMEKDRQIERQIADQKNEWAEIYGNQKQAVEKLNREISLLDQERIQLKKQLEIAERKAA